MMMFQAQEIRVKHLMHPIFPDSYANDILLFTYVLWRIMGISGYTHCAVVCGNREMGQWVYKKFVKELLENKYLKAFDHGFTKAHGDGWNITIPKYHARISILVYPTQPSKVKFNRRQPDLVIGVSLEEYAGVETKKMVNWLAKEFYSAEHLYESTIVFGTIYRKENIFNSIRKHVINREVNTVIVIPLPLFDENKNCFWEDRYIPEEIQEMLKDYDDKQWQLKYLCHTRSRHEIPANYFLPDGTLDEERLYKKGVPYGEKFYKALTDYVSPYFKKYRPLYFNHIKWRPFYGLGEVVQFVKEKSSKKPKNTDP